MALSEIIMLGDPVLQQVCEEVKKEEIKWLSQEIIKMWRLITEFREKYGRGRAMATPQSELIQHEYDHLNGILAIDRAAANSKSFRWIVMPEKTGRITDKDLV